MKCPLALCFLMRGFPAAAISQDPIYHHGGWQGLACWWACPI
jgi:hypothetical protein